MDKEEEEKRRANKPRMTRVEQTGSGVEESESEKAGGQGKPVTESRGSKGERQQGRGRGRCRKEEEEGQRQRNEKTTKRGEGRRGEHADIRRKEKEERPARDAARRGRRQGHEERRRKKGDEARGGGTMQTPQVNACTSRCGQPGVRRESVTLGPGHEMADPVLKHASIVGGDDVGKGDNVNAARGLQVARICPGAMLLLLLCEEGSLEIRTHCSVKGPGRSHMARAGGGASGGRRWS